MRLNETFGPVFYSVIRLGLSVNSFVAVHGFGSKNKMSLNFPGVSVNHSRFILGQQRKNWSFYPSARFRFGESSDNDRERLNSFAFVFCTSARIRRLVQDGFVVVAVVIAEWFCWVAIVYFAWGFA